MHSMFYMIFKDALNLNGPITDIIQIHYNNNI